MLAAYLAIAGLSTLFWIPILLRFYRSWKTRGNPISLGICAAIILLIWTGAAGVWQVTDAVDATVVVLVSTTLSLAVAVYCHFAFRLAERLFDDPRKKKEKDQCPHRPFAP
jgi:hypothetical protein